MSVRVTFECGGCFATAEGTKPLRREFVGTHGSWGFGTYKYITAEEVTPDGWVAFDPYTGCCYCPTCWDEIENEIGET